LQKDEQITGLIRLLSLALRVLTLLEFMVRKQLAEEKSELAGIYAGNRTRKTKTPRTETLLKVFEGITLTIIQAGVNEWVHLKPLSVTQKRILQLLGMTEEVYTCLVPEFAKVVLKSANLKMTSPKSKNEAIRKNSPHFSQKQTPSGTFVFLGEIML
jgi:hypothetical protein